MANHDLYPFTHKYELLRVYGTDPRIVDISVHPAKPGHTCFTGPGFFQLLCQPGGTKIACMPDFLTTGEMLKNGFIEKAMGV